MLPEPPEFVTFLAPYAEPIQALARGQAEGALCPQQALLLVQQIRLRLLPSLAVVRAVVPLVW